MALWRSGALALWRSGALALWRSGALALWRSGALALWRSGALALWRSGALALWRSGALALWRSGALALWRSGALALWRSGALALWRLIIPTHSGRAAEFVTWVLHSSDGTIHLHVTAERVRTLVERCTMFNMPLSRKPIPDRQENARHGKHDARTRDPR